MTHVHRWTLEPFLVENVPASCECGEQKTFLGGVPIADMAGYSYRDKKSHPEKPVASRHRGGINGGAATKAKREQA